MNAVPSYNFCDTKDCKSKVAISRVNMFSKEGRDLGIGSFCLDCRDEMRLSKGYRLVPVIEKREVGHNDAVVEDGKVKFGEKKRHVPIPEGWGIVRDGKCIKHDKFLNLAYGRWDDVEDDDIGLDCFENFAVLIRNNKVELSRKFNWSPVDGGEPPVADEGRDTPSPAQENNGDAV